MDTVEDVISETILASLEAGNYDIERIVIASGKVTFRLQVANVTHFSLPILLEDALKVTERDAVYMWENLIEQWVKELREAFIRGEISFQDDPDYTQPPSLEYPSLMFRYRVVMNSPRFPKHVQFCRFPMHLLEDCVDINVETRHAYREMMKLNRQYLSKKNGSLQAQGV